MEKRDWIACRIGKRGLILQLSFFAGFGKLSYYCTNLILNNISYTLFILGYNLNHHCYFILGFFIIILLYAYQSQSCRIWLRFIYLLIQFSKLQLGSVNYRSFMNHDLLCMDGKLFLVYISVFILLNWPSIAWSTKFSSS